MFQFIFENRFSLKMKDKVYRCCVNSAIPYGSETWCFNFFALAKKMFNVPKVEVRKTVIINHHKIP